MLSDVCSELGCALSEGNDDSLAVVRRFMDGVRGYLAEPFDYPKPVLDELMERAETFLDKPSDTTLVCLMIAAKTTQEFYDTLQRSRQDRLRDDFAVLVLMFRQGCFPFRRSHPLGQPPPLSPSSINRSIAKRRWKISQRCGPVRTGASFKLQRLLWAP